MKNIAIFLAGLFSLLPAVLSGMHGCALHSFILELLIPVITIIFCCRWASKARTASMAWLRAIGSFGVALIVQLVYLTWLHSAIFPNALLANKSKEMITRMNARRNELLEKYNAEEENSKQKQRK